MIRDLLGSTGIESAVFVDDQVDHFAGARAWPRDRGSIDCRLASWGYVRTEWLTGSEDYRVIGPQEAGALLDGYATPAPPRGRAELMA
jgi:hypothetical protein